MNANTATSTEGKPAANTQPLVASRVLVTSIHTLLDAQTKAAEKFASAVATLQSEAKSNGLDSKAANQLLANAYKGAYEKRGLTGTAIDDALKQSAPDRSKMIRLAFPTDEKAAAELEKVAAHNQTATGASKVGMNAQLEIARGNTTLEQVLKERAENKGASKGARPPEGTATPTSTNKSPEAAAQADAAKGLTAEERFGNQLAALYAYGKECGLSAETQSELASNFYAEKAASEGK